MDVLNVKPEWGRNYERGFVGFMAAAGSILSGGIAYFTRWDRLSEIAVCHTFIVTGPDAIIEARLASGVDHAALSPLFKDCDRHVFFRKPAGWSPDIADDLCAHAEAHVGEDYDASLLAAHALRGTFLGRLLKIHDAAPGLGDDPDEWICSELVAHVLDDHDAFRDRGCLALPNAIVNPQMLFEDDVVFEPWKDRNE